MVRGAYSGIRWVQCALIALTIHGMTPDPWDVTSISLTKVLPCILVNRIPTTADRPPSGADATDEKPDEVCTPACSAANPAAQGSALVPRRRHRVAHSPLAIASRHPHLSGTLDPVDTDRRLASLGRLTC